jgi:hypothetical protein
LGEGYMEESNQIQQLNQTIEDGFEGVSMAINDLKYPIKNSGGHYGIEIILIILIFVLISINKNLKKLIQLNSSKKE